jgi:hypothetical protein
MLRICIDHKLSFNFFSQKKPYLFTKGYFYRQKYCFFFKGPPHDFFDKFQKKNFF